MNIDRKALKERMIAERREFHAHAESGFTEFWTATTVAGLLRDEGYDVRVGKELMSEEHRMGVPDAAILDACLKRAIDEGADASIAGAMAGGFTAVAGVMANGPGPVVAFRFDIDAVDVDESSDAGHPPRREGFASTHAGSMHACGHDGHAAIGLALARLLAADRDSWSGTVKLIFQPAEEGVRGAKSVAESGFLDDVDYIAAGHLGILADGSGTFYSGVGGFLSTTKLDARFTGRSAHAGMNPELGRNALLAAASSALHLSGIPRHSSGATRVNVGRIEGGSGRNVIPGSALLVLETRGETSALNEYMTAEAIRILEGVAAAYGVDVDVRRMGEAMGADSDPWLMELAATCAAEAGYARVSGETLPLGGSEDYSFMMNRVVARGGKALYSVFGATITDAHHSPRFDFDEDAMLPAAETLFLLAGRLLKAP
ncbi:MAG: peptidase M20 [Spirochaetae bacterium HGW-Spirochaetae-3]|jgi:aminobenzoyl-glutamate utilization protein A|nr:MAG: peptidase M20 [Spirochaetae bacterium HGW-Spirochaetae-3]